MSKNEPPINTSNDIIVSPIVSRIFLTFLFLLRDLVVGGSIIRKFTLWWTVKKTSNTYYLLRIPVFL